MSITAALITKNEERNIEECLETVRWADEIVMVDCGSTDRTMEKAKPFGAKVYEVPFRDFASQKNAALERATGEWVFFVDADERVPKELAEEILEICRSSAPPKIYGVNRLTYFFGNRLRFSAAQDDYPFRLFPRTRAHFEQPVHERVITELPEGRLKNRLIHYSTRDLAQYQSKLDQYVPLELEVLRRKGKRRMSVDWLLRPVAKFLYLYVWRLGILDGFAGFQYAWLSAYYTFIKYWRFYFSQPERQAEAVTR